ncbi:MAG TPA: DUF6798 domain-containing protein, partial [Caulifigura sp.]|nr:DUF6798 domain-containing protein [Caulifigura sp.]
LSAASLLLVQSTGSWSGEWLIGGVESKVFSYGLVFAGWSALLQHRLPASGLWLGLATTLHPIVGMWATVATLCALAWKWWREAGQAADSTTPLPRLPVRISPALWWFCAAAPGIGWALPALRSADVATSQLADFIQVSYRLAHHLDPWTFPKSGHLFFGGLILFWLIAPLRLRSSDGFRFIDGVTAVAILFGVAATLLSYGPRPWTYPPSAIGALQLKMLKFYPFRLADLMAAVAVALVIARSWNAWNPRKAATAACGLVVLAAAVAIPGPDQTPGGLSGARRTDWIAALHWIKQNSPADALLLAANEDFGVKWWAERPEFVNYKDCPQDATGVVEWNNRLLTYTDWVRTSLDGDSTFSIADLSELHKRTGVTHLIVSRLGPIDAPAAYSNANFRVYQLDE